MPKGFLGRFFYWLNRPFFVIAKQCVIIDYWITKHVDRILFKKRFQLNGHCIQCKSCCRDIGVVMPRFFNNRWVRGFVITWASNINDFYFKDVNPERKILIFGCRHFNEERGCLNYKRRPAICRAYPFVRYFEKPILMPGCGYEVTLNI